MQLWQQAFHCCGFSCGAQALGERASVVVAPGLWSTGSVVVAHGFPDGSVIKNPRANAGATRDAGSIPGLRISPGEEMVTHSSILAWKISQTEEPGSLQSIGPQRVRRD